MTPAELVEEHHARMILEHAGLPDHEVHNDGDAVWQTGAGPAWSNGGTRLRFNQSNAGKRLVKITDRFYELNRPAGFWVSRFSTPANLDVHLKNLGFHCRKHFPAMHCDLRTLPKVRRVRGLSFEVVTNYAPFAKMEHPYFGRISTPLRKYMLRSRQLLCEKAPDRAIDLIAFRGDEPVGGALLYLDGDCSGLWDVGVPEPHRNQGIGTALTAHACAIARERGYRDCVLIASGMGEGVYRRVGFEEACKLSYWYSRLGRTE